MNVSYINIELCGYTNKYKVYGTPDFCCKVLNWRDRYAVVIMSDGRIRNLDVKTLYDSSFPQWQSVEAALEYCNDQR